MRPRRVAGCLPGLPDVVTGRRPAASAVAVSVAVVLYWGIDAGLTRGLRGGWAVPPDRIPVVVVVGGVLAVAIGYAGGSLLSTWALFLLPLVSRGLEWRPASARVIMQTFDRSLSWAISYLVEGLLGPHKWGLGAGLLVERAQLLWLGLPAIVLATAGYSLGVEIRRLRGKSVLSATTGLDSVLLGTDSETRRLVVVAGVAVAPVVGVLDAVGAVPTNVVGAGFLGLVAAVALPAVVSGRDGGGLVAAWLAVAVPLGVLTAYLPVVSGVELLTTNALWAAANAGIVGTVAYGLGVGGSRVARWPAVPTIVAGRVAARTRVPGPVSNHANVVLVIVVVVVAGLSGAAGVPPHQESGGDVSITVREYPCLGQCPSYEMRICGNGTVHFVGYDAVEVGYHRFTVPRSTVRGLLALASRVGFFGMEREYDSGLTDVGWRRISVAGGGMSQTVTSDGAGPPGFHVLYGRLFELAGDATHYNPHADSVRGVRSLPRC